MYNYGQLQNQVNTLYSQCQAQSIQYVNGIESARAYQMPPNSSALLMDANLPKFYVKKTDASGYSEVKAYDFKEETTVKAEYVTKDEFEEFKQSLKGGNE